MIDITENIKVSIDKLKSLPGAFDRSAKKTFSGATATILRIMKRPGLPPVYPLDWDSEKQRVFVMAKLRRENNLPYSRTDAYVNAWENIRIPNGEVVQNIGHHASLLAGAASGEFPGAIHVQQSGQSHLFAGRWRLIRPVIDAVLARLPDDLLQALRVEVDK